MRYDSRQKLTGPRGLNGNAGRLLEFERTSPRNPPSMTPNQTMTFQRVACGDLFDMDSVAMDSPRLAAIKAADIQTHHAPHMEEDPWLAIPMHAARERLKGYITRDEPFNTVADITASFGRVLDDCGMLFYGNTEREAQDAALTSLSNAPVLSPGGAEVSE